MKSDLFTICITNFARPEHLRRCLESVKSLPKVVVACYGAGPGHQKIIDEVRPGTRCYVTESDFGENRLLLQAVALADTPWVVILHDDDQLTKDFAAAMDRVNPGDAGFIGWDGQTEWFDNRPVKKISPWGNTPAGIQPSAPLIPKVTQPHGGMVQSPVTMMLRKDLAMEVLSWCEEGLKEFHTRPTMMIGNEIALLFGHLKKYPTWYHVAQPLVKFGHWEGSETVKWINGESPELVNIYDDVRRKFGAEQFLFRHDHIFPVFVHAYTTGGVNPRQALAHQTWRDEHKTLEQGFLIVPLRIDTADLPRNSGVIGDPRKMPYVKDLLDRAASFCYGPRDALMLTNDDVCIADGGLKVMFSRTQELGSTYAHRRDFHTRHLETIGLQTLSRKLTAEEIPRGHDHAGTDVVMMTKSWWDNVGSPHLPDFIIGCEAWDTIIIMVMRLSGSGWGWRNSTYHFHHGGWWEDGANRFQNAGQIHNRRLAKDYLVAHCIYRGEFEYGVKKDPAYPRKPPGCDSDPGVPVVKYMGDPDGFKPVAVTPAPVRKPQKKAMTITPMRLHPEKVQEPPKLERAIVYPYSEKASKWHELRYSLRSIDRFFEDKECPIHIYGTTEPSWMRKHPRIEFHYAWTYSDALIRGVQTAKEIIWMNDDIMMVRPTTWADCRIPRFLRPVNPAWKDSKPNDENHWQLGMLHILTELERHGHKDMKVFSTHTPYCYRRDEALQVFGKYGVFEKIPFEMAYFHEFGVEPQELGTVRTQTHDFSEALFLNFNDAMLTPELKAAIAALLPDKMGWENSQTFIP